MKKLSLSKWFDQDQKQRPEKQQTYDPMHDRKFTPGRIEGCLFECADPLIQTEMHSQHEQHQKNFTCNQPRASTPGSATIARIPKIMVTAAPMLALTSNSRRASTMMRSLATPTSSGTSAITRLITNRLPTQNTTPKMWKTRTQFSVTISFLGSSSFQRPPLAFELAAFPNPALSCRLPGSLLRQRQLTGFKTLR